ncbi:MAG TPA: PilZ domain-containing protein [Phycisphaerae bacterium]|nr:PilZ domain-containing protein [Phycisphaerae bacterium]
MVQTPSTERRQYPRLALSANVRFFHGPSGRELPARTVNISKGGMMMFVPVAAPLRAGQPIRLLALPGPGDVRFAPPSGRPVEATVVRVDRRALPAAGRVMAGVRFAQALC